MLQTKFCTELTHSSSLLRRYKSTLNNPKGEHLLDLIEQKIVVDATLTKKVNSSQFQNDLITAVKPNLDGFLDVARLAYYECVQAIFDV